MTMMITIISMTMFLLLFAMIDAFTMQQSTTRITSTSTTSLYEIPISSDRRSFVSTLVATSIAITSTPLPAFASEKDTLITNLSDSLTAIKAIPSLVDAAEWDKIRTVLKSPPVNELWNLGESKNTLVKLAKETGEFELLEMKDELAISLQMCDQYSYDNNFIYYQPGNGKIKTKEPMEMANKAISQLKEAVDAANAI